jgi:multisubunit Na+/H+ antiporter MnhG subunit
VSGREILADVLLGLAVAIVLASVVGILVMRDAYQKLHYLTPAALVAPLIVGLAVLAQSGLTENTAETWLALLFIMVASPFLSRVVNDYVTWVVIGLACLGGALAFAIR